jgi:rare lipoprotein A (peptidoglycan hydrolase)
LLIRHLQSRTRVLIAVGLAVAVVAGAAIGGLVLTGGLARTSTTDAAAVADQQQARGGAASKASRGGRDAADAARAEKARQTEASRRAAAERAAREAERQAAEKRAAEKLAAEKRAAAKRAAEKRAAQKAAQKKAAQKRAAQRRAAEKKAQGGYEVVDTVSGTASFFGDSGEYQPMACGGHTSEITEGVALWEIPCGTPIRITSKETGKSVIAPVTDRGPADWTGVAIDLLPDTWDALGVPRSQGLQEVTYEVLSK